jgi:hypothetical protein
MPSRKCGSNPAIERPRKAVPALFGGQHFFVGLIAFWRRARERLPSRIFILIPGSAAPQALAEYSGFSNKLKDTTISQETTL